MIKGCYCPATLWGLGDYVMFSAGEAEGRLFKVLRPQLRLIAGDSRGVLKGGTSRCLATRDVRDARDLFSSF